MASDAAPGVPSDARLREAARDVAGPFGLRLVVLFGSAARQDRAPSDLDLGVLGSAAIDAVALTNALTRALGTQAVDVTDLRRADPVLLALVAREGVPLFEREPGAFAAFASLAARRFADTRKFRDAQAEALRADIARLATRP
jgi:predicted nucleotidyltransferase